MKIPRDLSGHELVATLCRHWGYRARNREQLASEANEHRMDAAA